MEGYKSFLQARDPSILAWNRPKINPSIKMDLCSEFTDSTLASEDTNIQNEHLQVYLRIKPTKDLKDLYDINNNILVCRIPPGSQALRNIHDGSKLKKQYSFTKIYGPEVNQTDIFNDCIKKKVLEFINGRNSTIFTYGTSGSGKTYTILGTSENPGIIPRSLEYIFRTLPQVNDVPTVKPTPAGDMIVLENTARKNELNMRNSILHGATLIDKSEHIETYKMMQQRLSTEATAVVGNTGVSVGLWVSFAEVYNEYVYDLLVSEPARGKGRPKLRLAQDSRGNTYVKDLHNISVSSGLEAYEILQYGMQNLNYASTSVNSHSSRSHCIFTIKLVQWVTETEVQISQFNFCDLAGSERVKNTRNVGERLKESNNINTSLHVLGRCIESIRKSQKAHDSRMIPFRDSKLTRLFQRALSGHESITMVVNINTTREMFDESQHVLTFSAVAREIVMEKELKPEKMNMKKRFSQYIKGRTTALPSNSGLEETNILHEKLQSLLLEFENQQYVSSERETQVRREMMEKYRQREEEMMERWENRVEAEKKSIIETYEFKIEQMQSYYERQMAKSAKRFRSSSIIELDDTISEELEDVTHQLKLKTLELDQMKERYKTAQENNSSLQAELTQVKFDLTAQGIELEKEKTRIKIMEEEIKILRQRDVRNEEIIQDAKLEVEELEKEKKELETQLEDKCIEMFDLSKKVSDLNDQLSANIAEKNEQAEHVEDLEEKLFINQLNVSVD